MPADTPALNSDGTHKDASEIEWDYSPTQVQAPLPQDNLETEEAAPPKIVKKKGLSGKEPATIVAGKRFRNASSKMKSTDSSALDKNMKKFYGIRIQGKLLHF